MTVAMVRVNLTNDPQASFMFRENSERLLDPKYEADQALGADLATSAAYRDIHNAAVWKGSAETEAVETDKITLGFLNYRNPTRASSNIGDHVQTTGPTNFKNFNVHGWEEG